MPERFIYLGENKIDGGMKMARAVLCPICNGKGKVPKDYPNHSDEEKTCHGCGGKGWVEVSDPYYAPPYPYPVPTPWEPNPWRIWF